MVFYMRVHWDPYCIYDYLKDPLVGHYDVLHVGGDTAWHHFIKRELQMNRGKMMAERGLRMKGDKR